VYNGGAHLAEAIDAALAQTYKEFELVVRDDISSDGSPQILRKYKQLDARVHYRQNDKSLGLFGNYNECIQAAKGDFIKLYAQDDLLEPDAVEKMVAILQDRSDVALVTCAKRLIDDSDKEIEKIQRFKSDVCLKSKDVILANLIVLNNWIGEPSTVMFRREHAENGFNTDFYHWGDIDFWFRILQHGDLFVLHKTLCRFRRHPKSATTANLAGLYFVADIVRMWRSWRRYLEELGESEEHFFQRAVEKIALHVDHLIREEGLTLEIMRSANPTRQKEFSFEKVTDFREALFHAERRITTLMQEMLATKSELEHREGECRELRAAVRQMENSVSWKLTAPLRIIRSKM
jgi:glycosyltransferase involved in cell wall biosynthesis